MSDWLKDPSKGLVRTVRPSQIRMSEHVGDVLANGGIAMIQAPTGTGKSFAYLVPALESGKRVVVSTGKKNLQAQLAIKDLPLLTKLMSDRVAPYASLKGKANYACKLRFAEAAESSALDEYDGAQLARFGAWLDADPTGDFAAFPENVPFEWHARVGECTKLQCPHAATCGYLKARLAAKAAKVLVVNHALLAYDLMYGGGKLLGPYDALVVDEAHEAPGFFRKAFTYEFHEKQAEQLERVFQQNWEIKVSGNLRATYRALFRVLERERPGRVQLSAALEKALVDVTGALADLRKQCQSRGLLPDRPDEGVVDGAVDEDPLGLARTKAKVAGAALLVDRLLKGASILLDAGVEERTEYVGYTEVKAPNVPPRLFVAPLEIGPLVAPALLHINRCVFTSATLTSGDGFGYFTREFGLHPNQVRIQEALPSPFDYRRHSALWVTRDVPFPAKDRGNKEEILDRQAREIHDLLAASGGGAFVICPSYADMNALYNRVDGMADRDRLPSGERRYHLMKQESTNVDGLVADFKTGWHNVLFGVRAIGTGVDVPGLQLRLVILTGLNFPHFSDVLNRSRKDLIVRRLVESGEDEGAANMKAFDRIDVQLAGIELAQAAGRLIRTENDFGVLAVLDPRLHERAKNYSNSLRRLIPHPPCYNKEDLQKIITTIRGIAEKAKSSCSSP